jgi:hypothetical protein
MTVNCYDPAGTFSSSQVTVGCVTVGCVTVQAVVVVEFRIRVTSRINRCQDSLRLAFVG